MSGYTLTINGRKHQVRYEGERKVYDPPLPTEDAKRFAGRFEEMLATRSAPRCMTDDVLFSGVGTLDKQFAGDAEGLKAVTENAQRHGYRPSPNDFYMANHADFVGDPKAFISQSGGGRGQLRKLCESKGVPCEGAVKVKGRPVEAAHVAPIAADVLNRKVNEMVKKEPSLATVDRRELQSEVVKKHGKKS